MKKIDAWLNIFKIYQIELIMEQMQNKSIKTELKILYLSKLMMLLVNNTVIISLYLGEMPKWSKWLKLDSVRSLKHKVLKILCNLEKSGVNQVVV
jgi:hypothetical protein